MWKENVDFHEVQFVQCDAGFNQLSFKVDEVNNIRAKSLMLF